MNISRGTDWFCATRGPELAAHVPELAASCYFEEVGESCPDLDVCQTRLGAERRRVFRMLSERAAHGDGLAAGILEEIPTPEGMLGGSEEKP